MSNPLINGNPQQQQMNPQQMLEQLKNNPIAMLKQAGFNVPDGIAGNPMAMIQHLVQSGQIPKSRLQNIAEMMRRR